MLSTLKTTGLISKAHMNLYNSVKKKVRRQKIMYEMKYHQANSLSFIQVTKQILIKYLQCIKHYARCQGYKGELRQTTWSLSSQ